MKHPILKKSILPLLLLALTACSAPSTTSTKNPTVTAENNNRKTLLIDIDQELKKNGDLRGEDSLIIDAPLYIGDNDEGSFKGEYLQKASPIKVKIGDNDEVSFTGDHYTIKTLKLHNGEVIQMQDKEGNTFVEVEVVK